MSRNKATTQVHHYFRMEIDGKSFGPFPVSEKDKHRRLLVLAGVKYFDVFLKQEDLPTPPLKKRTKKENPQQSMLDAMGFVAEYRTHRGF